MSPCIYHHLCSSEVDSCYRELWIERQTIRMDIYDETALRRHRLINVLAINFFWSSSSQSHKGQTIYSSTKLLKESSLRPDLASTPVSVCLDNFASIRINVYSNERIFEPTNGYAQRPSEYAQTDRSIRCSRTAIVFCFLQCYLVKLRDR